MLIWLPNDQYLSMFVYLFTLSGQHRGGGVQQLVRVGPLPLDEDEFAGDIEDETCRLLAHLPVHRLSLTLLDTTTIMHGKSQGAWEPESQRSDHLNASSQSQCPDQCCGAGAGKSSIKVIS